MGFSVTLYEYGYEVKLDSSTQAIVIVLLIFHFVVWVYGWPY